MEFIKTCHTNGLTNKFQTLFPDPVLLSDNIIDEIEVLKNETIVKCKESYEKASLRNKNAVVCFDEGQYKHLSVILNKVHYNTKVG